VIDHTVALYCITDDLLKAVGHTDDCRRAMTDAEVLTTALLAAHCFGGNAEHARRFLRETGLMPRMLSRSRLNRRLHAVAELAYTLFHQLGAALKELHPSTKYLLDSFPVPVCDNIRIQRAQLLRGSQSRGRSAAHRRYFYGVRVQVVTTEEGVPVEFAFLPGSPSDVRGLGVLPLDLPEGSELYMDSGYTDYAIGGRSLGARRCDVRRAAQAGLAALGRAVAGLLQAVDAQAHRDCL
jgi:Transposase DDE domain